VQVAQQEKHVDFPKQLVAPVTMLNHNFGLKCSGGCIYSLMLCNVEMVGASPTLHFHATSAFPEIEPTEDGFTLLNHGMEQVALPMYQAMINTYEALEVSDQAYKVQNAVLFSRANEKVLAAMKEVREHAQKVLRFFYSHLNEVLVKKDYWMAYVQGFEAWGLNGDEGLTGAHSLCINAIDSFCGIDGKCPARTFVVENRDHMTAKMQNFLVGLERNNVRKYMANLAEQNETEIVSEYGMIVNSLHIWRLAHVKK